MLIVWFFAYKKLAQFAVRCALPPRRSESPVCATDNKPFACCICWAGLLSCAVFPPWNEGPNFGFYSVTILPPPILHKLSEFTAIRILISYFTFNYSDMATSHKI